MKDLRQSTETKNYIVCWSEQRNKWELRGKFGAKTFFINSCEFQVPLLIKQEKLEARKKCQAKLEKHRQKVAS